MDKHRWRSASLEERSPCGIQDVWSPSPPGVFYSSTTRPMLPNSRFHGASLRLEAGSPGDAVIQGLLSYLDPSEIGSACSSFHTPQDRSLWNSVHIPRGGAFHPVHIHYRAGGINLSSSLR